MKKTTIVEGSKKKKIKIDQKSPRNKKVKNAEQIMVPTTLIGSPKKNLNSVAVKTILKNVGRVQDTNPISKGQEYQNVLKKYGRKEPNKNSIGAIKQAYKEKEEFVKGRKKQKCIELTEALHENCLKVTVKISFIDKTKIKAFPSNNDHDFRIKTFVKDEATFDLEQKESNNILTTNVISEETTKNNCIDVASNTDSIINVESKKTENVETNDVPACMIKEAGTKMKSKENIELNCSKEEVSAAEITQENDTIGGFKIKESNAMIIMDEIMLTQIRKRIVENSVDYDLLLMGNTESIDIKGDNSKENYELKNESNMNQDKVRELEEKMQNSLKIIETLTKDKSEVEKTLRCQEQEMNTLKEQEQENDRNKIKVNKLEEENNTLGHKVEVLKNIQKYLNIIETLTKDYSEVENTLRCQVHENAANKKLLEKVELEKQKKCADYNAYSETLKKEKSKVEVEKNTLLHEVKDLEKKAEAANSERDNERREKRRYKDKYNSQKKVINSHKRTFEKMSKAFEEEKGKNEHLESKLNKLIEMCDEEKENAEKLAAKNLRLKKKKEEQKQSYESKLEEYFELETELHRIYEIITPDVIQKYADYKANNPDIKIKPTSSLMADPNPSYSPIPASPIQPVTRPLIPRHLILRHLIPSTSHLADNSSLKTTHPMTTHPVDNSF